MNVNMTAFIDKTALPDYLKKKKINTGKPD